MEPFIYQISFESMTAAEFAGLPCESGVLSMEEQVSIIFRIITGKGVENRFRKKQQPEGQTCRNWKPVWDYHLQCNACGRRVCMDCFAASIANAAGVCSNCRTGGNAGKARTMTLTTASRDNCAGSR